MMGVDAQPRPAPDGIAPAWDLHNNNVATGDGALFGNTNGASNTASGHLLTHGSNNIDIGNEGVAGESGAIRIGTAVYVTSSGERQYGLIAEEVAKVYPELVIRGASGTIEGVRYEELSPMLINEAQQQRRKLEEQPQEIAGLKQQLSEVLRRSDEMQATLGRLQSKDSRVAMR